MRLDLALAHLLPSESRSRLGRLIDEGKVEVAGRLAAKRSREVVAGETIDLDIPAPVSTQVEPQEIPLAILYQDRDIAVIDKPAGLVVHPGAGHRDSTLVNALLHHLDDLSGIGGELRPGIVHRLDKDTSGLLVIAKNDQSHRALAAAWNSDTVRKQYLAIVYGTPKDDEGVIEGPIGRDPRERRRMAVVKGGRSATTLYKVVERLRHASLIRCTLKTGRTHQIRVHLKSLGHPIVGDPLYSGPQWKGVPHRPTQKALASFRRQALHAERLEFPHPTTGEMMRFQAPVPEDMQALIAALRA